MKTTTFILVATLLASLAFARETLSSSSEKSEAIAKTEITWNAMVKDLGTVEHQKPVTVEFSFTNSGDKPLVIQSVKPSCGCTSSYYEKKPIQPGEKSVIKATYNAAKKGKFNKSVLVKSNTKKGTDILKIQGEVN